MDNLLRKPFRYTYSSLSFILIGLNLAVFMINMVLPRSMYYLAMIPSFVINGFVWQFVTYMFCLLYTSPSPRDVEESRMPSSA